MAVLVRTGGPRDVEYSPRAALAREAACAAHPRARQLMDGIEWILARKPEIGRNTITREGQEPVVFGMYRTDHRDRALPGISVVYTYDERTVRITSVRIDPTPTPVL